MNATLDMLRTRRSVPPLRMTEPGPSPEQIDTILTLASRVPDHGKLAPWRFIVIASEARARIGTVIANTYASDNPEADAARLDLEARRLAHA
ncbi:nitroreductase, partial [Methylobacterium sp. WL122]